ncbi:MAG: hypothetical protein K1X94_07735 [Sandaracinaceae bacterium]|nr:hypothetical protein [Sandaracinaceae bacterium]
MRRALVLSWILSVMGCVSSSPASAQTSPRAGQTTPHAGRTTGIDAQVRELLSGVEDAPAREELLALGPDALEALIRLHGDAQALPVQRLRAITCASWFDGDRAHGFLVGLARTPSLDPIQLRTTLRALAAREGAQAVPELVRHASHADVAVREAVLQSLAMLATDQAVSASDRASLRATLESLLGSERDAELVRAIRARLG